MFGLSLTLILSLGIYILWRNAIIDFISSPLTSLFNGGNQSPDKKPYYSIATTKRKRGQYYEAIAEVRKQLDKFPNDFEGVLLLAGIVAFALTQLADWHMKIAADVDSARAALQKIVMRSPHTEAALQARLKMAHLEETEKIILSEHDRQPIPLQEGVRNIGLLDSTDFLKPKEIDPSLLAEAHVKHLCAHPHDTEVREKLAIIYAQDFNRLDLAVAELEFLISEPNHRPKQVARWLNLLADLQIHNGAEYDTVRDTLEKIVEQFPDMAVAQIAQRRLALLKNEFRGQQKATVVKLGVYEQNIGLKCGSPPKLGRNFL